MIDVHANGPFCYWRTGLSVLILTYGNIARQAMNSLFAARQMET